jgi:hypothetical protein
MVLSKDMTVRSVVFGMGHSVQGDDFGESDAESGAGWE